ncbi:MAG: beta-Ala-His dipeptidase [Peptoniphilaceae bacterium]|nr:beta-Ala-His dipeptidase [Peptoniphilaceae bacterium]MDY3738589.1 beta-Ala-His dipeptidase [Peptoniphilaceae bacterium]
MEINQLEPKKVFYWFEQINNIPRGSGNEKGVSDFLVKFAEERNLEVSQDEALNVLIKKPASKGYENSPIVALQGHMDMVAVADEGVNHDFLKDPIEMEVRDGMLYAKGTSLGADDGMGVAYALAILDDENALHGPLEVLITTEEETSMGGAMNFDTSKLSAKYLINIDSEEEGEFTVGCAGGIEVLSKFKKEYEKSSAEDFIQIKLKGATGGHSGMMIDRFRANAVKLLGRLLLELDDFRIAEISGGEKKNVISQKAYALLQVKDKENAKKILKEKAKEILKEFESTDPNLEILIEDGDKKDKVFTKELSYNLAKFIYLVFDGLFKKDLELNTITTSANLGVLVETEDEIHVTDFVRSGLESEKQDWAKKISILSKTFGAEIELVNDFPVWEKQINELVETAQKVWKDLYNKDSIVTTTHGGLETGFFAKTLKNTTMVSIGPTLFDVHSPKEHADIKSCERVFEFTKKLLESLK